MNRYLTIRIEKKDQGIKLEEFLRRELGLSRAQIRSMKYRKDGIQINGKRERVSYLLQPGDEMSLSLEREDQTSDQLIPVKRNLSILYEDTDVICVEKESGIPVHPSGIHYEDSLSNYLVAYFQEKGEKVQIRSIGRLDLDTSGVMVFAKNRVSAARLWKQKEEGLFGKEYLAWCEGSFPEEAWQNEQMLEAPLAHKDEYTMEVREDGKRAVTFYQAVEEGMEKGMSFTKLRVRIQTGRMHQIRVHMAYIGHPLLGDARYGNGMNHDFARLCAEKVWFRQPFTGQEIILSLEKFRNNKKGLT